MQLAHIECGSSIPLVVSEAGKEGRWKTGVRVLDGRNDGCGRIEVFGTVRAAPPVTVGGTCKLSLGH